MPPTPKPIIEPTVAPTIKPTPKSTIKPTEGPSSSPTTAVEGAKTKSPTSTDQPALEVTDESYVWLGVLLLYIGGMLYLFNRKK